MESGLAWSQYGASVAGKTLAAAGKKGIMPTKFQGDEYEITA
jgi:hypothetical protein